MNCSKLLLLSLSFGLILAACNQREIEKKTDTPKAFGGSSMDFSSYRSGNIVDELYKELLDKNPEIKKLEVDFVNMKSQTNEVTKDFYKYDNKSKAYYNEAIYDAAAIKDSTLQKKLLTTIEMSKDQYATKSATLRAIITQIDENNSKLNDQHTIFKIILTLPLVEDFQRQKLPNTKGMKELITTQENLLKQVDSLTPGY